MNFFGNCNEVPGEAALGIAALLAIIALGFSMQICRRGGEDACSSMLVLLFLYVLIVGSMIAAAQFIFCFRPSPAA